MTDRLRAMLADAAGSARNYAHPEAALASARRTRTRRHLIATSLVAAAAALIALVTVPALTPDDTPRPPVPAYPATLTPPQRAPELPETKVGPALLIYAPCVRGCSPFLVLPGGTQYALPKARRGGPATGYTLSPDGRWLGQPTRAGFQLRDLTSSTRYEIVGEGPGVSEAWAWSPDSTWALLVRHTDGVVHYFEVVKVDTRQRHRADPRGQRPLAVQTDGTVLYWREGGKPAEALVIADNSMQVRAELTPGLGSMLRAEERLLSDTLRLGTSGRLAAVTVSGPYPKDDLGRPSALLLLDLADGRAVTRVELPTSAWDPDTGIWEPRALLAGAVLLLRWTPERTEVVRLDTATGERTALSVLPRDSQVILRATTR